MGDFTLDMADFSSLERTKMRREARADRGSRLRLEKARLEKAAARRNSRVRAERAKFAEIERARAERFADRAQRARAERAAQLEAR